MPDRRGNNRADRLKNIVRDPRVGLLFLVPGSGTTLRVNGRAHLRVDDALCASFTVEGKTPRSVIVIEVEAVYFQCARAIHRSDLWNPQSMSTRNRCRARGRSSTVSANRSAARPTTANGRSGRRRRCGKRRRRRGLMRSSALRRRGACDRREVAFGRRRPAIAFSISAMWTLSACISSASPDIVRVRRSTRLSLSSPSRLSSAALLELRQQHGDVGASDQQLARQIVLRHAGMPVEVHQHVELRRFQVERQQRRRQGALDGMAGARHRDPVAKARIVPGERLAYCSCLNDNVHA